MTDDGADRAGMTPLQALILDRMAAKDWSPAEVEGRGITHATLHRYMNPVTMRQLPRQSTLDQLAAALDLPVVKIREAAWASLTGETRATAAGEASDVVDAIRNDPALSDRARDHLLNQYGILREWSQVPPQGGDQDQPSAADMNTKGRQRMDELREHRSARRRKPQKP